MVQWLVSLGAWNWFILAALLMVVEILAPGMFMLGLGSAAVLVGIISLSVSLSWQAQLITFAVLSLVMLPIWRMFARRTAQPEDSPFLNRRNEGLVGQVFTLDKPIVNGIGAVRINDTVWRVIGPDCPAGSRVRVARADGPSLVVETA
jgi:membrane protein implicated in regulation of membrane protease activity